LKDPDNTIRKQAEEDITQLPEEPQRQATEVLDRAMQDSQATVAQSAYLLLGRLRGQGVKVEARGVPLMTRINLALSLKPGFAPLRAKMRVPATIYGLLGCLMGTFLFSLFFGTSMWLYNPPPQLASEWFRYLMCGLVITGLISLGAVWNTNPVYLHADSIAAAWAEGWASIFSWQIVGAGGALTVLVISFNLPFYGSNMLGVVMLVPLVGAIRVFTAAAYGSSSNRFRNFLWQTVIGAGMGIILITLLTLLFHKAFGILDLIWVLLMPVCFGIGMAFAAVDNMKPDVTPNPRRATRWMKLVALVPIITMVVLSIQGVRNILKHEGPNDKVYTIFEALMMVTTRSLDGQAHIFRSRDNSQENLNSIRPLA
jgi:hypothetical protein